jgi:hypothetical protein
LLTASFHNKTTAVNEQMMKVSFQNHVPTEAFSKIPEPNVELMRFSLLGSDKMGSLLQANVNDVPQELMTECDQVGGLRDSVIVQTAKNQEN